MKLLLVFLLLSLGTAQAQGKSGLPVQAAQAQASQAPAVPAPQQSSSVGAVEQTSVQEVRLWIVRPVSVHPGPVKVLLPDSITLGLQSKRDGYVTLLACDAQGLFRPLTISRRAVPVKAGTAVVISVAARQLGEGATRLLAFAAERPLSYAEARQLAIRNPGAAAVDLLVTEPELSRPAIRDLHPPTQR